MGISIALACLTANGIVHFEKIPQQRSIHTHIADLTKVAPLAVVKQASQSQNPRLLGTRIPESEFSGQTLHQTYLWLIRSFGAVRLFGWCAAFHN
jgi:hypothetical protein